MSHMPISTLQLALQQLAMVADPLAWPGRAIAVELFGACSSSVFCLTPRWQIVELQV